MSKETSPVTNPKTETKKTNTARKLALASTATLFIGGVATIATGFTRSYQEGSQQQRHYERMVREVDLLFPPRSEEQLQSAQNIIGEIEEDLKFGEVQQALSLIEEKRDDVEAANDIFSAYRANAEEKVRRTETENVFDDDDANLAAIFSGFGAVYAALISGILVTASITKEEKSKQRRYLHPKNHPANQQP